MKQLPIGIAGNGVVHTDADNFDIDTRFRMVRECGAFDYYEKSPPMGEVEAYLKASEKHGLPLRAGGFYYTIGRDEALLEWNLRIAAECGAKVHNIQIKPKDVTGRLLSDSDVARSVLSFSEAAAKYGVTPAFEIHINMWSENFARVERVGTQVEKMGGSFGITLDHSHVIFKIDNPKEQIVLGMKDELDRGGLVLDPFSDNAVTKRWLKNNWVRHMHARPSAPNNPVNIWAKHPDGSFGRGVQYPFLKPAAGEWHSEWRPDALVPWKEVVRQTFAYHATHPDSPLGQVTVEMIPGVDYGAGSKYSNFQHAVALANWLRVEWEEALKLAASREPRETEKETTNVQ